jgi:tyrosine-protein phosphatase YwqE
MLDFHNHILPGIDDGSPDLETSLRLLNGLKALGFDSVIPSPHTIADTHPNTPETIQSAYNSLNQLLSERQEPKLTGFASEYMMDDVFLANLKAKREFLCVAPNTILVELSYAQKPDHLEDYSFQLQIEGYIPILAHPERYGYYHKNAEAQYDYLKDLGFDFQLNLLSLTPYYGKEVQKIAHELLEKGYYDYACTDLHHERHLNALQDAFTAESLRDLMKKYRLKNDTLLG